jgi:hypothetical protein
MIRRYSVYAAFNIAPIHFLSKSGKIHYAETNPAKRFFFNLSSPRRSCSCTALYLYFFPADTSPLFSRALTLPISPDQHLPLYYSVKTPRPFPLANKRPRQLLFSL